MSAHTNTAYFWRSIDRQRERIEASRAKAERHGARALREIAAAAGERTERQISGAESDSELCELAERRAETLADRIAAASHVVTIEWLNAQCEPLDARPFAYAGERPEADQLAGMLKRAMCPLWWRRQLRRACVRRHESRAVLAGLVGVRREWYCTTDTVRRRAASVKRNAAILDATELENDAGQVYTLAQLVAASPASKAIRRGELMTRIRGCEEWGESAGMVGLFTTNTAPSRFHSQGGANPNHTTETPRDAHAWLCATWARARAALHRAGVPFFGFRVVEPHKDGCPHWHMLLWTAAAHLDKLTGIIRRHWLKHEGDEPGAAEHRFKWLAMEKGGASGYVAKYIAKNIDDHGAAGLEGHHDDGDTLRAYDGDAGAQSDLFDDSPCRRVEAWATAWGIRQFQPIGQPPVTIWRELRRVQESMAAAGSPRVQAAYAAVHRKGERRADWAAYMAAQGGAMTGRDYLLRLATWEVERVGRYETTTEARPAGVFDVERPREWLLSNRRAWKPRGTWAPGERDPKPRLMDELRGKPAQPAQPPWTRFNNCTRRDFGAVVRELVNRNAAASSPPEIERGDVQPARKATHEPPPDHRHARIARAAALFRTSGFAAA